MKRLPDKIYLILENAVDEIVEELEKEEKFSRPIFHMIERELRFMIREKIHKRRVI